MKVSNCFELKLKEENTIATKPINAITSTNGTNCLESNLIPKVMVFCTLSPDLIRLGEGNLSYKKNTLLSFGTIYFNAVQFIYAPDK